MLPGLVGTGFFGSAAASSPTVRGFNMQSTASAGVINWTFPTGSVAGDLCVMCYGHGFSGAPSNGVATWNSADVLTGTNWNGGIYYRVLTATDISNGFTQWSFGGSFAGAVAGLTFVGATGGLRDTSASRNSAGATSRTVTTDSTPVAGDYAISFGSQRVNAAPSCDLGTQLDVKNGTNHGAVLNGGILGSGGAQSANFTYNVSSGGDYQAVVVVLA